LFEQARIHFFDLPTEGGRFFIFVDTCESCLHLVPCYHSPKSIAIFIESPARFAIFGPCLPPPLPPPKFFFCSPRLQPQPGPSRFFLGVRIANGSLQTGPIKSSDWHRCVNFSLFGAHLQFLILTLVFQNFSRDGFCFFLPANSASFPFDFCHATARPPGAEQPRPCLQDRASARFKPSPDRQSLPFRP